MTSGVLDRVGHTLERIVTGIEAGVFPPHPTASSTSPFIECPFCDPDGFGVVDLRRAWERKARDPGLAVFAGLIDEDPGEGAEGIHD